MIINKELVRADIAKRKAMPEFGSGPDAAIERIHTMNKTQRSFNMQTVEALLDELESVGRTLAVNHEAACSLVDENEELKRKLDVAEKRIAELEVQEETLRPVGVMSEKAFHRLEGRESRFIALWPRPGIYLPRKRPEDGVIVYARTATADSIKGSE